MDRRACIVPVVLLAALAASLTGCMDAPTGGLGQHCPASKACDGDLVCNDANFCMPLQHDCIPEAGMECTCWDGSNGATTCKADGSGYRECIGCPPAPDAGCGPGCIQPQCSCEGIECGENSCGITCGVCAIGQDCVYGRCRWLGCGGKSCGEPDGYGGQCVVPCQNGVECKPPEYICYVCVPACGGTCGIPDGCGGYCDGSCGLGMSCEGITADHRCEPCVPDCSGKACGDFDGCSDVCPGGCPNGAICVENGMSYHCCTSSCGVQFCGEQDYECGITCDSPCPFAGQSCIWTPPDYHCTECQPDCAGKQCGADNLCGATCTGACAGDGVCIEMYDQVFQCCTQNCAGRACGDPDVECGAPCDGPCPLPGESCIGNAGNRYCSRCTPDCVGKACGDDDGCNATCDGTCSAPSDSCQGQPGTYACAPCVPSCYQKACGAADGCGGTCHGACANGMYCLPDHGCVPDGCKGAQCGASVGASTCPGACAGASTDCEIDQGTGLPACAACGPAADWYCNSEADCSCGYDCVKLDYLPCKESATCPWRGICAQDCSATSGTCASSPGAECLCTNAHTDGGVVTCLSAACVPPTGTVEGRFIAPIYDDCATATITPGAGNVSMLVDGVGWPYTKFYGCRMTDGATGWDVIRIFGQNPNISNDKLELSLPTAAVGVGGREVGRDGLTVGRYGRFSQTPPALTRLWTEDVAFEGGLTILEASTGGGSPLVAVLGAFVVIYHVEICDDISGSPLRCSDLK